MVPGEGARLFGGRWNSPGLAAVDLGDSIALATMELLVHLGNIDVLQTYRKMPVYIPVRLVMHIDATELPRQWEYGPRSTTRVIGDRWLLGNDSAVLQVPSAVVSGESNYLVNPNHADLSTIEAGPVSYFRYDRRLVR